MKWAEYIEMIKNGPIDVRLRPPTKGDCDNNFKFLAFFPKEKTWGYLSLAYIEANDPDWLRQRKEGEAGYVPLHLICSHWLPCPPILGEENGS